MGFENAAPSAASTAGNAAPANVQSATRPSGVGYAAQAAALKPAAETRRVDEAVSGLTNLSGPAGSNLIRTSFDDPNAAAPNDVLPFDQNGGWDATKILSKLGQADAIDATDSDGVRCVQAVSLASHVLQGPTDVFSFLGMSVMGSVLKGATMNGSQLQIQTPSPRVEAAAKVVIHVQRKILDKTATYGDLSWAQEALHALATPQDKDNEGTPATDVMSNVNPGGIGGGMYDSNAGKGPLGEGVEFRQLRPFAATVDALQEGEQLIVIQYLQWTGVQGRSGHQLIIFKTGGKTQLYDPQETDTKVQDIGAGGKGLERCFHRDANRSKWVSVAGKRRAS
ncbi:MAG: hypothetical protein IV100_24415 [Myxococcales bacterium]|nr:hypothetical protein [Myxococcales bacterium]